jgi:hypothetical protein
MSLPRVAAVVAAYVDRLPDGADISIKTLAKMLPFGQQAVGTALRKLTQAGFLHRSRQRTPANKWVTRTYFSRVAQDSAWWAAFVADGEDSGVEARPVGLGRAARSLAFRVLARLGLTDARMGLSERECVALEPLAEEWLERGADAERITRALTSGLPEQVTAPAAFAAKRLRAKLPPFIEPEVIRPEIVQVCGTCESTGGLVMGICGPCRVLYPDDALDAQDEAAEGEGAATTEAVRAYVAEIRAAMRGLRLAPA